jgi:type II secretory pathway component PulJ
MKKLYATLLELIVALSLAAIMFSMLFGYYYTLKKMDLKLEYKKEEIQEWRTFQARLSDVFLRLKTQKGNAQNQEHSEYFFFTEKEAGDFVFTYNNGTALDPVFSNTVFAKLYLDKKGRLTLIRWPWKKESYKNQDDIAILPFEKEILLQGLEKVTYEFYNSTEREWLTEWTLSKKSVAPDFIKMQLYFKKDPSKSLDFSFQIRNTKSHKVIYSTKEAS